MLGARVLERPKSIQDRRLYFRPKKASRGQAFACYGRWLYALRDPAIPNDNSYQSTVTIAGTKYLLDGYGVDQSICKG